MYGVSAAAAAAAATGWFDFSSDPFTSLDYIAVSTGALSGALAVRRPDHHRSYTLAGILLMALVGGLAGGVSRDLLIGDIPAALTDPVYFLLAITCGVLGYFLAYRKGRLFREGLFQFVTSVALPWYAITGAYKADAAGLPVVGVLMVAVVSALAGRYLIDTTSAVAPKHFICGEWFLTVASFSALIWILARVAGSGPWLCALLAFTAGFVTRMAALYRGWEEPVAKAPQGTYQHSDGRPLLGRKIAGKSVRELRDLGLIPDRD